MSLMWIPPSTTEPPFRIPASAAGTSSPAGAKIMEASKNYCRSGTASHRRSLLALSSRWGPMSIDTWMFRMSTSAGRSITCSALWTATAATSSTGIHGNRDGSEHRDHPDHLRQRAVVHRQGFQGVPITAQIMFPAIPRQSPEGSTWPNS
jgi:hypothetical protein